VISSVTGYLEPRVHFEEVEVKIRVDEELDGSCVLISHRPRDLDCGFTHLPADFRGQIGIGSLLDHLLVAQILDGALALAQVNHVAVLVADDLNLDVARFDDALLEEHLAATEAGLGLGLSRLPKLAKFVGTIHTADAAPSASRDGLKQDGVADLVGDLKRFQVARDHAIRARHDRAPARDRGFFGASFVAHGLDRLNRRADELDAQRFEGFGKMRSLAEVAIAGVDGVSAADLRGHQHVGEVQVGVAVRTRADTDGFIGDERVQALLVGLGIDGDAVDAHLAARPNHSAGDLSSVRDKHLLQHGWVRV